jgi:hypothetical protein
MTAAHDATSARIVLEVTRTIGPDATGTHIPLVFSLDKERDALDIAFSYEPKVLADEGSARELIHEGMRLYADSLGPRGAPDLWRAHMPLRNLLTLSLDGPSGFRGCAHRYGGVLVTLDTTTATPGFLPGVVQAGRWTAVVSVHLVATPRCDFRVRVSAR